MVHRTPALWRSVNSLHADFVVKKLEIDVTNQGNRRPAWISRCRQRISASDVGAPYIITSTNVLPLLKRGSRVAGTCCIHLDTDIVLPNWFEVNILLTPNGPDQYSFQLDGIYNGV